MRFSKLLGARASIDALTTALPLRECVGVVLSLLVAMIEPRILRQHDPRVLGRPLSVAPLKLWSACSIDGLSTILADGLGDLGDL